MSFKNLIFILLFIQFSSAQAQSDSSTEIHYVLCDLSLDREYVSDEIIELSQNYLTELKKNERIRFFFLLGNRIVKILDFDLIIPSINATTFIDRKLQEKEIDKLFKKKQNIEIELSQRINEVYSTHFANHPNTLRSCLIRFLHLASRNIREETYFKLSFEDNKVIKGDNARFNTRKITFITDLEVNCSISFCGERVITRNDNLGELQRVFENCKRCLDLSDIDKIQVDLLTGSIPPEEAEDLWLTLFDKAKFDKSNLVFINR